MARRASIVRADLRDSAGGIKTVWLSAGLIWPKVAGARAHERIVGGLSRSAAVSAQLFGQTGSRAGEARFSLANGDGRLDDLLDLVWTGGDIRIWRVTPDAAGAGPAALADADRVFTGRIATATASADAIDVTARDLSTLFDRRLPVPRYAGTGGLEGPAEMADRVKPARFGRNVAVELTPFLLDGFLLVYQLHYRAIDSVIGVWDQAVPLAFDADYADFDALAAADVPPGRFATALAQGLVRLGAKPVGLVVADFRGDAAGGFVETATDLLTRLHQISGVAEVAVDAAAMAEVAGLTADAPLGLDFTGEVTTAQAFELVMASVGGTWRVDRLGRIAPVLYRFAATPSAEIGADRVADLAPGEAIRPVGRLTITHSPVRKPHESGDISRVEYQDGTDINDLKPTDPDATAGADRDAAAKNKNFQAGDRFWQKIGDIGIVRDPATALEGEYLARTSATGATALINDVNYPIGAGAKVILQGYVKTSADYATAERGAGWVVRWLDSAKGVLGEDRIDIAVATTEWSFLRQVFDAPVGTVFANLAARSDDLVAGTVWFDGGDLLPIASDVESRVAAPGLLNVLEHPLVKGDRINDDTIGLIDAINQANSEHRGLYFPTGPGYFISAELPFPVGMVWAGDRPWLIEDVFLDVQSVTNTGQDGIFQVTLDPATTFNLNKLIEEDTVRFTGVSPAIDDAGSYGLVSFDDGSKSFVVRRPGGGGGELDVAVAPDGAQSFHNVIDQGSLLIFRSLQGVVADGERHLNSVSNKNFAIRNMGFVGAGVNSQFSGGLVFRRDTSSQNPRTLSPVEHFIIENFRIAHCSTPAALDIRGALNGVIRQGELVRNVFVNIALNRGDDGGSNTMTEVSDIFSHQCTVPFYFRQAVYCKFWNVVAEGAPLGVVVDDCRSCDVHYGWETLKARGGYGYPYLQLRSNDIRVGSSAGFWNTEETGFAKAGVTIAGESANSQETLAAVIEAPYHQGSFNRIPVLVVEAQSDGLAAWQGSVRTGLIHVDVTQFEGSGDPDFDLNDGPAYWSPPRLLTFDGLGSVDPLFADFNHFRYTDTRRPDIDPAPTVDDNDPGPLDDANAGFTLLDQWVTNLTLQRWICTDASAGAAVWRRFEEVWAIEFESRIDLNLAPVTAPVGAHATRRGRNWGVDISVHWPLFHALETDLRGDGAIRVYLDLEDLFPVKSFWKVGFVAGANDFLGNTRLISRGATKETIINPETGLPEDVIALELNATALQPGNAGGATQTAGQQTISVDSNRDIVRAGGSFMADGFAPGQTIRLVGFTAAGNEPDRSFTVESVTDTKIVLHGPDGLPTPETGDGDEKVGVTDGYIWENAVIRHNNGDMTLDQFSTGWTIQSDFKFDDEAAGKLVLYARIGRIASPVAPRNGLILRGCQLDVMNGRWTVADVTWDQFEDRGGYSTKDAIEILTSEKPAAGFPGQGDATQVYDTGVVVLSDDPDFDRHNRTAVHLLASNHVEIFDEQGFVRIAPEVEKPVTIPDGASSADIYHANVEGLSWLAIANGELVQTEVIDRTTVRVIRAGTAGDLEVTLRGTPKRRRKPADLFGEDRSVFS